MWHASLTIAFMLCTSIVSAAQTCNVNISSTTPTSRFTINNDGTVTDKETNLVWKQCVEGVSGNLCITGSAHTITWQSALQITETLNAGAGFANQTDWRLANVVELESIVELQCENPALNLSVFPNTPASGVWSSSPSASNINHTWHVNFFGGSSINFGNRSNFLLQVRLVRNETEEN